MLQKNKCCNVTAQINGTTRELESKGNPSTGGDE